MWEDLYGSDDEAAILDYMFMQKRKKKPSAANRPKKIKVPRATKADVELRQLLAAADRETLEQLIYDMAHEKKGRSVESLLETLGGGKSKVQEVQAHNEVLADMVSLQSGSRPGTWCTSTTQSPSFSAACVFRASSTRSAGTT